MRRLLILTAMVCCVTVCRAGILLSEDARVSVVTCEQSYDLYSVFGHSAIRIMDEKEGFDVVMHWGVFDYETPNFMGRFLLGTNMYMMGLLPTDFFLTEYGHRGSRVWEQEVNMTARQKQRLWDLLWINLEPENVAYKYNFICDNCATRVWRIVVEACEGSVEKRYTDPQCTYRTLIHEHVGKGSFLGMGIDMILGVNTDTLVTQEAAAAFPDRTMLTLSEMINTADSLQCPLVSEPILIVDPQSGLNEHRANVFARQGWINGAMAVALMIMIVIMGVCKWSRIANALTATILAATGIIGVLIMVLWFFSEHPLVSQNYNILWLNPLNLISAVFLMKDKWKRIYAVMGLIEVVTTVVWLEIMTMGVQVGSVQMALWGVATLMCVVITIRLKMGSVDCHHKKLKKL